VITTENLCLMTAQPEFINSAFAELKLFDKNVTEIEEIAPDILLCQAPNVARLMSIASNTHPTFARHIAPVQTIIDLDNNEQDIGTIALTTIQLPNFALLERGTHFAVQTRLTQTNKADGERAYSSGQINRTLAEALAEETGAVEDIKKPQVIISLLCTMHKGYLGISEAKNNLSSWPGGARHYAQTKEQVSRAEFKLLEALEVFGVTLPSQGQALDLGAAPGGWTRLLLDAGIEVVAVDPARLDPRLAQRRGLEHYRGYAEDYLEDAVQKHKRYDLIVNDMRMDAREAARLLSKAANCLRAGDGFMVSVFKLPHATLEIDPFVNLNEALIILKRSYQIVQARQLFHNRQEVTVITAQPIQQQRRR
jgi:23S rRNA (cytidine2498-2'-O)-methyltransferase